MEPTPNRTTMAENSKNQCLRLARLEMLIRTSKMSVLLYWVTDQLSQQSCLLLVESWGLPAMTQPKDSSPLAPSIVKVLSRRHQRAESLCQNRNSKSMIIRRVPYCPRERNTHWTNECWSRRSAQAGHPFSFQFKCNLTKGSNSATGITQNSSSWKSPSKSNFCTPSSVGSSFGMLW